MLPGSWLELVLPHKNVPTENRSGNLFSFDLWKRGISRTRWSCQSSSLYCPLSPYNIQKCRRLVGLPFHGKEGKKSSQISTSFVISGSRWEEHYSWVKNLSSLEETGNGASKYLIIPRKAHLQERSLLFLHSQRSSLYTFFFFFQLVSRIRICILHVIINIQPWPILCSLWIERQLFFRHFEPLRPIGQVHWLSGDYLIMHQMESSGISMTDAGKQLCCVMFQSVARYLL